VEANDWRFCFSDERGKERERKEETRDGGVHVG